MKMKRPHMCRFQNKSLLYLSGLSQYQNSFVGIYRQERSSQAHKQGKYNQVIELLGYKGRLTGHGFRLP